MMKILLAALTALFLTCQSFSVQAQDEEVAGEVVDEADEEESSKAEALVETLHAGLIEIMQGGEEMGLSGRIELITPVVESTFDVTTLGMSSIGLSVWRDWDDDQKRLYISTFRRFLATNYASQFDNYSGQSFETVEMVRGPKRTKLVKTRLNRPNDKPVSIDYLTRSRRGEIGIIDIFLDGSISEAARRRSEFSSVYQERGYDGLIESIEGLIADMVVPEGEQDGIPAAEDGVIDSGD